MDHYYCATCGQPRGVSPQRRDFSDLQVIEVGKHHDLRPGRAEESPQLLASLGVWRNGGTSERTHLCDRCLQLGLRMLRERIDRLLEE